MSKWRWQDYLNVLIGAWLVSVPWVMGFADSHPLATWSAVLTGIAIGVVAAADMEIFSAIEEWILVALGIWAMVSPWVLGLSANAAATLAMVLAGLPVVVLTLWEFAGTDLWRRWREHAHG